MSLQFQFDPDDKIISIVYLSLLNDILQQQGQSMKGYDGAPEELTDYKKRVSPKHVFNAFAESLREAPAGIGLCYGTALNLVAAETIGQLIMSCPDVGQALEEFRRFQLLLGLSTEVQVHHDSGAATIDLGCIYSQNLPLYIRHFLSEAAFAAMQNQARLLTGIPLQFRKLYFPYARPAHSDQYIAAFDCELEYDAESHRVVTDPEFLNRPIITANEQIRAIKAKHCSDILRKCENHLSLENRIRSILLQTAPDFPTLDEIASRLHTSRSCLYRKLRANRTSYQNLINEFKKDQSINLLRKTSLTIPEIAEALGFSDASSFRRAFKSWTGYQPSAARG